MASYFFYFDSSYIYLYLLGGISTENPSCICPVYSFYKRESRERIIRKDDGTIPDAYPLWQDSVTTSTRILAESTPLNDVVIQSLS